jgi:3-isopropylmalate dehydrogenase
MRCQVVALSGDGIGPEVVAQAVKVLEAVGRLWSHQFEMTHALIGGAAIDSTGVALPPETLEASRRADAVLLGAVGGPRWDKTEATVRPEQGLLGLRKELGLYANLRPVAPHPRLLDASPIKPELLRGVDFVVVRELTGGIYFGEKRREANRAVDVCEYTTEEIERIVRLSGSLAMARKRKLVSVDKANVLETSRLWRSTTERVIRAEFPEVSLEHLLVDAAAMHLIRRPADFDVIVTENMFGDILTDEASVLAGSLGMLPSASLGAGRRGLYEPIHGSAPDIAGKGIANPYGTILSAALLLRHSLGLEKEALAVEKAVEAAIERRVLPADVAPRGTRPASTTEAGDAVVSALE